MIIMIMIFMVSLEEIKIEISAIDTSISNEQEGLKELSSTSKRFQVGKRNRNQNNRQKKTEEENKNELDKRLEEYQRLKEHMNKFSTTCNFVQNSNEKHMENVESLIENLKRDKTAIFWASIEFSSN
eukprot:Pgem_evm1s9343